LFPLGKTSRSFRRVGVARRHFGQNKLVASNSPKLSRWVISFEFYTGRTMKTAAQSRTSPQVSAACKGMRRIGVRLGNSEQLAVTNE